MIFVISAVFAYLIGSFSSAFVIGKRVYGVDLRTKGSGNLGATNVKAVLGTKPAIVVLILDAAKGAAAVALARFLIGNTAPMWLLLIVMLFAIAGHTFPFYLSPPKGGKGVATGAGALFFLMPSVASLLLVVFVLVVYKTRYVSLGSIMIAVLFPLLAFFKFGGVATMVVAGVVAILVIYLHRANISRLLGGTESKFGDKRN